MEHVHLTYDPARLSELRDIVADVLELEPGEIADTSRFKEDHDADSLRAIEILARIEKLYKVEIPQAELAKMTHLLAVYDVVRAHADWDVADV
jgi:acyl carrier protein